MTVQRINEAGLQIIREAEGLRLKAYTCPAGKWTIGHGHTGPDVKRGSVITEETAERLLLQDVAVAERAVRTAVFVPLNDHQFAALVSFCFNVGAANFRKSTLRRLVNERNHTAAANEFPRWVFAAGKKLPGLVKRREKERALFLRPVLVK